MHSFQRITISEILEDEWFKKDYKQPIFDEKEDANLDDVEAVFKDSEVHVNPRTQTCMLSFARILWLTTSMCESISWGFLQQEHHVMEKREEQPVAMNAFELISMSKGLNLENLFGSEQVGVVFPRNCFLLLIM